MTNKRFAQCLCCGLAPIEEDHTCYGSYQMRKLKEKNNELLDICERHVERLHKKEMQWHELVKKIKKLDSERFNLACECDELVEAVKIYLEHKRHASICIWLSNGKCTCGFLELQTLLEAIEGKKKTGPSYQNPDRPFEGRP